MSTLKVVAKLPTKKVVKRVKTKIVTATYPKAFDTRIKELSKDLGYGCPAHMFDDIADHNVTLEYTGTRLSDNGAPQKAFAYGYVKVGTPKALKEIAASFGYAFSSRLVSAIAHDVLRIVK